MIAPVTIHGCVCTCVCARARAHARARAQLCPTLCILIDSSLPGSFVHEIFQARMQE